MAEQVRLDLIIDSKGATKNVKSLRKEVKATSVDTKKVTGSFKNFSDTVTKGLTSSTATAALFASGNVQLQKAVGGVTIGLQGLSAAQVLFNTSTKGGVTALKLFKLALAATGIGAIVVALGSLIAFLTKTQKGVEIMNKVSAALGATMDVLIDRVSALGEFLFNAFSEPKQSIEDLGNFLKDFFLKQIQQITDGITGLGKAFSLLFAGEFKKALDVGTEAAINLAKGLTPLDDIIESLADGIGDIADEISREATSAADLQGRLDALIKSERLIGVERSKAAQDIAELRFIAEDRTQAEEVRLQAVKDAAKIEEEIVGKEIANAQERVAIITAQVALGESLEEDLQKQADAEVALNNLLTNSFNLRKSLASREEGLRREVETARKETQAGIDAEEKEEQDKADREIQALLDQRELDAETEIERRQLVIDQRDFDLKQLELGLEERNLITAKADKELDEIKTEFKEKEKKRDKEAADLKEKVAVGVASTLSAIAQLVGNNSEAALKFQKAIAITQIILDTARGISAAVAAGAGVPFPANIPAILTGITAVLSGIASAKAALSKAGGGPSAPSFASPGGGGGGGAAIGTPAPPTLGAVQETRLNPDGTVPEEDEKPDPIEAFVVETKITSTQKNVKRIEDQATFG